MQFFHIVLVSCYLQEKDIQITKIFTTCVKKMQIEISNFLQEKCPYPKSEGLKRKQYLLSAPASCKKGLLLAENIKGSSVEINVDELNLPSDII